MDREQQYLSEQQYNHTPLISGPGFRSTSPARTSSISCSIDKCSTLCMPCSFIIHFNSLSAVDGLQPQFPIRALQSTTSIIVYEEHYTFIQQVNWCYIGPNLMKYKRPFLLNASTLNNQISSMCIHLSIDPHNYYAHKLTDQIVSLFVSDAFDVALLPLLLFNT